MSILGRKKSSSNFDWQGEQIKLQIVYQKQGDANWPISVKIHVKQNNQRQIYLSQIIWRLKQQSLYDCLDTSVSYYHQARKTYIFGFIIPSDIRQSDLLNQQKYKKRIHESAFGISNNQPCIKLRFRNKIGNKLKLLKDQQKKKYNQIDNQQKVNKQKEKTISEVVEKVALWRKFYTGFMNDGQLVHLDLDSAAVQIGIVKKTLDDYLLQIRNGKRYGFNFHRMKNNKIGDLRSFVKQNKNNIDKK